MMGEIEIEIKETNGLKKSRKELALDFIKR